jgi:two-component system phosphate regulon sensor histidine kinase PhoR
VRRKKVANIIVLLAVALVALIGVQLYWVQNAYTLRESDFTSKVMDGLAKTATAVENDNTCFETFSKVKINPYQGIYVMRQGWDSASEAWKPQHDTVKTFWLYNKDNTLETYPSLKFSNPVSVEILMRYQFESVNGKLWRKQPKEYSLDGMDGRNFRDRFAGNIPLAERIDTANLDSFIHLYLPTHDADYKFEYGIIQTQDNGVEYASAGADKKKLQKSSLSVNLFSDKYFSKPYKIAVYYPNKAGAVLGALWGMLLTSAAIIVLLIYAFWYFVRMMLRQKKLSEMKTDFINNMTHEFKTPVTNISLALETIGEAAHQLNGLRPILNIIGEENNRLRENVERILQIAAVDKENLHLKLETVDLHSLIQKVVRSFDMQLESNCGKVKCSLQATYANVVGDETHIINILYNLLDNAIKYSSGCPEVFISTQSSKIGVLLSIEDRGIGMNTATQKRIFDKFYRAQTGNVHDVKGFGLGLSYVKSIVDAHRGSIDVKSEPGKGSRFDVFLPFNFTLS